MKHQWDGKLSKKTRFVTCKVCGTTKESCWYLGGIIYFKPHSNEPTSKAGDCSEILKRISVVAEGESPQSGG